MGWTKRQFVEQAFEEIGLANYVYDLTAEQMQSALRKLDSMMALWNGEGIRLGYPLPSSPETSSLDDESGVPDSANQAIYAGLALLIASGFGKTPMPDTKKAAYNGYQVLLSRATMPPEKQLPGTMPSGQGNKQWRNDNGAYLKPPTDPLVVGPDSELTFE